MAGEEYIEYLYRKYVNRKMYFDNTLTYVSLIKDTCRSLDPECRVILFGSIVRGNVKPDSDIDVLVITNLAIDPWNRSKLYVEISKKLDPDHPFEIHIITPEEYEKWYGKFIDVYIEVKNNSNFLIHDSYNH